MLIKLDEDMPRDAGKVLLREGSDCRTVKEQGMSGWRDADVWQAIQSERRFLVTCDERLADVRLHPPGTHAGVLLLRPSRHGARPLVTLLEEVLAGVDLRKLRGAVCVASSAGVRTRKPCSQT